MLNGYKKAQKKYWKIAKIIIQRRSIQSQMNSRFTPASNIKIRTVVLIPNYIFQKGISENLQPIRKGSFHSIAKPKDIT